MQGIGSEWIYDYIYRLVVLFRPLTSPSPYFSPNLNKDVVQYVLPNASVSNRDVVELQFVGRAACQIVVLAQALHGYYSDHLDIFKDRITYSVTLPNRADYGTSKQFMAFVQKDTWASVSAPLNMPAEAPGSNDSYAMIGLVPPKYQPTALMEPYQDVAPDPDKYWSITGVMSSEVAGVSYLPYFSHCEGFGSYLPIFTLMEFEENGCSLKPPNATTFVKSFPPTFDSAETFVVDRCTKIYKCYFEEDLLAAQYRNWWFQSSKIDRPLFYLSRDPIGQAGYKSRRIEFDSLKNAHSIIPVNVLNDVQGSSTKFPRTVKLSIFFFQRSKTEKQIVKALMQFSDYSSMELGTQYNLQITFQPMDYLQLLNSSSFEILIYIISAAFLVIFLSGGIVCIWFIVRALSSRLPMPKLFFFERMRIYLESAFLGLFLSIVCYASCLFVFWVVIKYLALLDTISGDYRVPAAELASSPDLVTSYRSTRLGLAFGIVGSFLLHETIKIFIPSDNTRRDPRTVWRPLQWQRSMLILIFFLTILVNITILEFSFSDIFKAQVSIPFLLPIIVPAIFNIILRSVFADLLILTPLQCSMSVVFTVIKLGNVEFTTLMVAKSVETVTEGVKRLIVSPFLNMARRTGSVMNAVRTIGRELGVDVQMDKTTLLPGIQLCKAIEDITDMNTVAIRLLSRLIGPVIIGVLFILQEELKIGELSSLRSYDLQFYFFFELLLVVGELLAAVYFANMLELAYGFRSLQIFRAKQKVFLYRRSFWLLHDTKQALPVKGLPRELHLLERCGFNSQFYFLLSSGTLGIIFCSYACQMLLRSGHNFFYDPLFIPVCFSSFLFCYALKRPCWFLTQRVKLWDMDPAQEDGGDEVMQGVAMMRARARRNHVIKSMNTVKTDPSVARRREIIKIKDKIPNFYKLLKKGRTDEEGLLLLKQFRERLKEVLDTGRPPYDMAVALQQCIHELLPELTMAEEKERSFIKEYGEDYIREKEERERKKRELMEKNKKRDFGQSDFLLDEIDLANTPLYLAPVIPKAILTAISQPRAWPIEFTSAYEAIMSGRNDPEANHRNDLPLSFEMMKLFKMLTPGANFATPHDAPDFTKQAKTKSVDANMAWLSQAAAVDPESVSPVLVRTSDQKDDHRRRRDDRSNSIESGSSTSGGSGLGRQSDASSARHRDSKGHRSSSVVDRKQKFSPSKSQRYLGRKEDRKWERDNRS
eukprot:GILI01006683.1.p1 GENE.GILI01006683.1~~GILI01006683.1.p1  ORF type:complete len:1417 (+),score=262.99 GILI01006683.1:613-4251(+)